MLEHMSIDDAKRKFDGTIIMYEDYPFIVSNLIKKGKALYCDLAAVTITDLRPDYDKDIPCEHLPEPLRTKLSSVMVTPEKFRWWGYNPGYYMACNTLSYCVILPKRQFSQGLCRERVTFFNKNGDIRRPYSTYGEIAKSIIGSYYPLSFAMERESPVAVSRNFAVSKNAVWYKGHVVATINDMRQQLVTFSKMFSYLPFGEVFGEDWRIVQ